MTTKDDGGPAFPTNREQNENDVWFNGAPGMSLRDWFAGQAMIGMLHPGWEANAVNQPHLMAKKAYRAADAMLAARKTEP